MSNFREEDENQKNWREKQTIAFQTLATNVGNVGTSVDKGMKKIASSLDKAGDVQVAEIELNKILLIRNLEQEILDFIINCEEKGITLDISRVKLDFKPYSYISLKNCVEKYIKLISFIALDEETKYKESQEYVQGEIDKLIMELPPFMKKYDDYNYRHFFIDKMAFGLYRNEDECWGTPDIPEGVLPFSSNVYKFTDYKGNLVDLMANIVLDLEGEEVFDFTIDGQVLFPPYISAEMHPFDSKFAKENPDNYLGYREKVSIFENGELCSEHSVWFNYKSDYKKYRDIVIPGYYSLPMFKYYYWCCGEKLKNEFLSTLTEEERLKSYTRANYEAFDKFIKEKGIIDFEQKLESGELNYSFLLAVINPIEYIVERINSNLSNAKKFNQKYYEYLQDTIAEYTQILRELKLQAIELRRGTNNINTNQETTQKGATRRKVYRMSRKTSLPVAENK